MYRLLDQTHGLPVGVKWDKDSKEKNTTDYRTVVISRIAASLSVAHKETVMKFKD